MEQKGSITIPLISLIVLFPFFTNAYPQEPKPDTFDNGVEHYQKQARDETISKWSKIIAIDPKNAQAYYKRGIAYSAQGDLERAILDYNKTIEINPGSAEAYCDRGLAYSRKKQLTSSHLRLYQGH